MRENKKYLIVILLLVILAGGYFVYEFFLNDEEDNQVNQVINNSASENIDWWVPAPEVTWQWQLSGDINTSYDVDVYDLDLVDTPQDTIDALHQRGIKVICYFSAGSWEDFRSDASEFPTEILGKNLEGWDNEKWLDISNYEKFSSIMKNRLDLAVTKKCDGIEPDNVDGYQNNSGFLLSFDDQLVYNKWLAEQAHERKLSIGLKNDLDQINDLVAVFDFAVNEQCFEFDECEALVSFINQGKAVLGVEYGLETKEFCEKANNMKFSWLQMDYDLDGSRIGCR